MCDPCAFALFCSLNPGGRQDSPAACGDHFGYLDGNWTLGFYRWKNLYRVAFWTHWNFLGKESRAGKINRPHGAQAETQRVGRTLDEGEQRRHSHLLISWEEHWHCDCRVAARDWIEEDTGTEEKSTATLCCRWNVEQLYLECCKCHAVPTTAWGQR